MFDLAHPAMGCIAEGQHIRRYLVPVDLSGAASDVVQAEICEAVAQLLFQPGVEASQQDLAMQERIQLFSWGDTTAELKQSANLIRMKFVYQLEQLSSPNASESYKPQHYPICWDLLVNVVCTWPWNRIVLQLMLRRSDIRVGWLRR